MSACFKHVRSLLFVFLTASFLAVSVSPSAAQPVKPEPAEWKEISDAEMDFTEYPADSNATAVILSDIGELDFTRSGEYRLERHTRIKLLDEAAYDDHGTVTITYRSESNAEDVRDIDGHTFVRAEDGSIKRIELDDDDIFEEEIREGVSRVTFTLPDLEPGAVIEYKYEYYSEYLFSLPTWSFQTSEPTLYSEYNTRIPTALYYVIMKRGSSDYDTATEKEVRDEIRRQWVATDIPALREEPFMTTIDDYRMSLIFQLKRVENPRTGRGENFITSWQKLAKDLREHSDFGGQLGRHGEVKDRVELITADLSTPEEKMQAIYDFVSKNMEWNGRNRVYVSDGGLDDVLERRTGTAADINMLLCSMMRIAGIEAHPVLISTRSNGAPVPIYPFVRQFNSLIIQVENGDQSLLLDATDADRPMGMLPYRALNHQGWKVAMMPQWIGIPPTAVHHRGSLVRAEVSPGGDVTADIDVTDKSIAAVRNRELLEDADSPQAFVRDHILNLEADVDDVTTSGLTVDDSDLQTSAKVKLPAYAQVAGDMMYLNPVIIGRQESNQLESETRSFPVDFGYPHQSTYTLSLTIPEGWEVMEIPENKVVKMSETVAFQRIMQVNGNIISMRMVEVLNSTRFAPSVYTDLRGFFDALTSAHSEPIVLKRSSADEQSESR